MKLRMTNLISVAHQNKRRGGPAGAQLKAYKMQATLCRARGVPPEHNCVTCILYTRCLGEKPPEVEGFYCLRCWYLHQIWTYIISGWLMASNFLTLNPSKTKFLIIGRPTQLSKLCQILICLTTHQSHLWNLESALPNEMRQPSVDGLPECLALTRDPFHKRLKTLLQVISTLAIFSSFITAHGTQPGTPMDSDLRSTRPIDPFTI